VINRWRGGTPLFDLHPTHAALRLVSCKRVRSADTLIETGGGSFLYRGSKDTRFNKYNGTPLASAAALKRQDGGFGRFQVRVL
jgi:hypothetical protein